jgi:3-deoxy-D-manno-octulosonic-acid transferase
VLRQIDLIAAQDATYAQRFRDLGARAEAIHVTGSMKYDGAQTDRQNSATQRLAALAGFESDDTVFLAGSTQEPEESMAIGIFRRLSPEWPQLRLVLVPRHPDRFEAVARLLAALGLPWQRRTALEPLGPDPISTPRPASPGARMLLVDVVGELGAWWGAAHIALVGGSFGNCGGQNMIEPAAYGAAVCFGPNTWNFRDIVSSMLVQKAAVVVHDSHQLLDFVRRCLEEPQYAAALGGRAQGLVLSQLGATDRTLQLFSTILAESRAS